MYILYIFNVYILFGLDKVFYTILTAPKLSENLRILTKNWQIICFCQFLPKKLDMT